MSTETTPPINYTARDFLTIKAALTSYLKTKFPNTWRDFTESNAGISILDIIAYSHDVLSFALDYTANEMFLETARDRSSVLLLGNLVGYKLRTASSASVACVISIPTTYPEAVILPKGTVLKSTTGVDFAVAEDARIAAGQTIGSAIFVEGVNRTDSFISDGTAFQKFELSNLNVIQGTIEVLVAGDSWNEYESLAYAGSNDNAFACEYDNDNKGRILFGDGTVGNIPPIDSEILVTYRTGGGVKGNLALNELVGTAQGYRELIDPISYVTVSIANSEERGSGGSERETTTHAKLWIPKWIKANGRAVTEDDYDVLANAFIDPIYGSPAFAKSSLKQQIPELNTVLLSIWSYDSAGDIVLPSIGLKSAISDYFNNDGPGAVKMICTHTEVVDGEIIYIDCNISIKVNTDYVTNDVILAVQSAITDLLKSPSIIPGADFRISKLYNTVQTTLGVQYCIVRSITASIKRNELISVGDGTSTLFNSTISLDPGLYLIPNTIEIYYGDNTEVLSDDGNGNICDVALNIVGSINYNTGVVTYQFSNIPVLGELIYINFRSVIDYQRNDIITTGDGSTTRYRGSVTYPPINPYDSVTGQKGIVFSDGVQVVIDDGDGNIIGDVDVSGVNRIDYSTGAYDFSFNTPPANNVDIFTAYRQILRTASQDLPIEKTQICVKGLTSITIL